ncbi:MAG TPA: TonB-dependent receptor [Balneolales bacterium]|nr:TonB-dependent receptor [Balneolales bacterium]
MLLVCVIISPVIAFAQTTVTGTVIDQETHKPIAEATITVKGTDIHASTNNYGKFEISSKGQITALVITCIGYQAEEVKVTNPQKSLNIQLSPKQFKLPGIEVTGSNQLEQAQSVGILSSHDLKRFSGLRLSNTINTIPGVFMQSRTPFGGAHITIRGYYPSTSGNNPNFNGQGYEVYLNDIPITDASGITIMDGIDYSSLGNVKVIKGPSSSLYGSYIGGTVLMNTTRPTPNQSSIQEKMTGGNYGLFRTSMILQSAGNNSDITVNYGHQNYNSFRPHSKSKKDFIRINGNFRVSSNQILSGFFSYGHSYEELAGEIDASDFYARRPIANQDYVNNNSHVLMRTYVMGVTDNYQFNGNFTNKTTLFTTGFTSGQPFAHGFTDLTQFNFGGRTSFGYTGHINSIGVNGTLGVLYQRSNIANNGVFIVPAPPHPQFPHTQENFAMNYSAFTQWEFSLPSKITVTIGVSLNKNDFGVKNLLDNGQVSNSASLKVKSFNAVFDPRISVSKVINHNFSVYANVSSGYTPPMLSSATASDGTVNMNLEPEHGVQYEIGTKGSFAHNRLAYRLSLFDLENTNKLVSQTVNSVTFTTNAGKQRNKGLEASLSYQMVNPNDNQFFTSLRPWISYAYSDFKYADFKSDNNNNSQTANYSGNYVARVPKNTINAGLDLQTQAGIYLDGTYQYVGKAPVTFDNSTFVKSYDLLSMKLGYKTKLGNHFNLNLYAGGDNLLGSTYYTFLFVGPNITSLAQAKDGGRGDGYIIPGSYKPTIYGNFTISYIF